MQVDQRGISLRFPRFLRVRDDKAAEDSTGPEQVGQNHHSWSSLAEYSKPRLRRCTSDKFLPKAKTRINEAQMTTFGRKKCPHVVGFQIPENCVDYLYVRYNSVF
jgi:hypothetical protein